MSRLLFSRINASFLPRNDVKLNNFEIFSSRPELRCKSTSAATRPTKVESSDASYANAALNDQDEINPNFVNRNPRNLEKMCYAYKPRGYSLDYPSRTFWHKIVLDDSNRHTSAYVEHYSGEKVVTASTKEWAIKRLLYSTTDVSAAKNIGIVLGQRCLESGILHVRSLFSQEQMNSDRINAFLGGLKEGGLSLEESFRRFPRRPWD